MGRLALPRRTVERRGRAPALCAANVCGYGALVPLLVGPFVGLALGAALAWIGRVEAPREDDAAFRARAAVAALFAALCFAPACAYFVIFAGDWSLFYLIDERTVPSAIELIVILADAALPIAGFAIGHRAARRRADRVILALIAAPAAIAAVTVLASLPRLRIEGTFHQVGSHFGTQPVSGSPLGWSILWMGAMISAGFVIAARALAERPPAPRPPAPAPAEPDARRPLLGRRR